MSTYDKMTSPNGRKIQVESAIRDGNGKNIINNYAKQDGAYENLYAGNLITDQNWKWVNDFEFGTGTVDTVFDGEATFYALRGKTEWEGTTPSYVNVVSNKSVTFNLFNPTLGYAHVVESDNENGGLCIYGEGITTSNKLEFSETSDFASSSEIIITEETNSMGETYLNALVPSDGYVRIKNTLAPSDLCIANVWGGNRVNHHPAYEEEVVTIGSSSYFPTGMKSISYDGEDVVYDEMYANKYYTHVKAYDFGATPSLTYGGATGTYNFYYMNLSDALEAGYFNIGGSTKFKVLLINGIGTSTSITEDSACLYHSGNTRRIYFAIAQSEDTSYTYTEDTTVVDAETFASELADKGHLYKLVDDAYVEVTEYESNITYYYISATNLHGLNGQAIVDEIKNKIINYQTKSMNKTTYTGTTISPAKEWSYKMGDFGTEELNLADGFPVVPLWVVYYPINALETIQQLPNNYVSLESAEALLHQVGDLEGFDFDSISVDEETGNMKVNGLTDTKETMIYIELGGQYRGSSNAKPIPTQWLPKLREVLASLKSRKKIMYEYKFCINAPTASGVWEDSSTCIIGYYHGGDWKDNLLVEGVYHKVYFNLSNNTVYYNTK